MKYLFGFYFLFISLSSFSLDEDEWLGLQESKYKLGLAYNFYSDNEDAWNIWLSTPFLSYSELDFDYGEWNTISREGDVTLSYQSIRWRSDPYASWNVELGYLFKGKRQVYEVEQAQIGIFRSSQSWLGGIRFYSGDATGFVRERIRERFSRIDSSTVDVDGVGMVLQKAYRTWAWQLQFDSYNYNRDLNAALSSPLFMFLLNDVVLNEVFVLTNWNFRVGVQKQFNRFSTNAEFEQYESVVENREENIYKIGVNIPLGQTVDFLANYSFLEKESTDQLNLALQFNW